MNILLAQDLSVYQLVMSVQAPPQPLPLCPATLLSLVRTHIDLLIEQQIAATLWVKLPPGKIWHSEIQRYHQLGISSGIYTCQIELNEKEEDKETVKKFTASSHISVQSTLNSKLRREYFLIVLSPHFCSLILACRPYKKRRNQTAAKANKKTSLLLAINSFEGKVIQQVLDGIKESITPKSDTPIVTDLICPPVETLQAMSLHHQLLTKQIQHQERIHRQITAKQLARVQEQNQKLHEIVQVKDEDLSKVCQELRTPITHMKTALSLLNSPNLKVPQRQRYLQMLTTQCDRQNALISGMLDLVQLERNLEKMPLEPVRLGEFVPGFVSTYQSLAKEKGIMLAYTVPSELPSIWCVSGGLRQIAINLLSNSIKFTPNGGQVWVRARLQGEYVQLEFRDTGIGIAESEISKIFERFYQVRPVAIDDSSGVGLGLTIVQLLLQRCGGSISVKSKLYEGSTFTVQFTIAC